MGLGGEPGVQLLYAIHFAIPSPPILLERAQDIRTIQELLSQRDLNTTMIYTHVINCAPRSISSPADLL